MTPQIVVEVADPGGPKVSIIRGETTRSSFAFPEDLTGTGIATSSLADGSLTNTND